MRRAARVDVNQRDIVEVLRQVGASVQHLHHVGQGCPDLLVGYRGRNYLLEVKTAKGGLTEDEQRWIAQWRGQADVVRSVEDALASIGALQEVPG